MKKQKNNHGITLIALVITIIVLLILVGVSIRFVLGENGIIVKSKISRQEHEIATILEKLNLEKTSYEMTKAQNFQKDYQVKEFLDFAIQDKVISQDEVVNYEEITENTETAYLQIDGYMFKVYYENEQIKIIYLGTRFRSKFI